MQGFTLQPASLFAPAIGAPQWSARRALAVLAQPLGWALATALVGAYVWMFSRYAVDFPVADDWTQILPVPYYFGIQPTAWKALQYLFSLSIEHRIVTLRLAAIIQATLLGGLNFTVLMAFGTAVLTAGAALVVWTTPRTCRPWIAALAAALLLSPINCEAQFWASGALAHFGVIGYSVAALFLVSRPGARSLVAGACLACAAMLTTANGLMVCPAIALMLWVQQRPRAAAAWIVIGVAAMAVYFVGYERPSHVESLSALLVHPLALVRFYLAASGSVAVTLGPSLVIGMALSAAWLWLISRHARVLPPFLVGCAAFLVLSYAAMTIGRAAFGDEGALLSRYRAYSEMFVLVTAAAVVQVVGRRAALRVAAAALSASIVWFIVGWHTFVPIIAHASISYASSRAHYAATQHAIFDQWPAPEFGDFVLHQAQALGYFQPVAAPALPVIPETRPAGVAERSSLLVERLSVQPHTVTIRGFVPPGPGAAALWLDDGARMLRVPLHSLPGVETPLGQGWAFFWGTVTLAPGNAHPYRIGYGVDTTASTPLVFWTDQWVPAN